MRARVCERAYTVTCIYAWGQRSAVRPPHPREEYVEQPSWAVGRRTYRRYPGCPFPPGCERLLYAVCRVRSQGVRICARACVRVYPSRKWLLCGQMTPTRIPPAPSGRDADGMRARAYTC